MAAVGLYQFNSPQRMYQQSRCLTNLFPLHSETSELDSFLSPPLSASKFPASCNSYSYSGVCTSKKYTTIIQIIFTYSTQQAILGGDVIIHKGLCFLLSLFHLCHQLSQLSLFLCWAHWAQLSSLFSFFLFVFHYMTVECLLIDSAQI